MSQPNESPPSVLPALATGRPMRDLIAEGRIAEAFGPLEIIFQSLPCEAFTPLARRHTKEPPCCLNLNSPSPSSPSA